MRYVTESFPVFTAAGIAINHSILSSIANYYPYDSRTVKYIVLHYTGNSSDKALSNARYFNSGSRSASAHYFVDDGAIYQSVRAHDGAWAVGGTRSYKHADCRNLNSISIEMCCSGNYAVSARTEANAAALCAELCRYIGIDANEVDEYVLRHWDVWAKDCPSGWTGASNARWNGFKNRVKNILRGEIDLEQLMQLKAAVDALTARVDALSKNVGELSKPKMVYDYIDDNMPAWARPTIQRLVGSGRLKGDEAGRLGLTDDMLKILVIMERPPE